MEINLKPSRTGVSAELEIKSGSATISEDVVEKIQGQWKIPATKIEQFITISNEMSRFNGATDIEFVYGIFDAFLNDEERKVFIAKITGK